MVYDVSLIRDNEKGCIYTITSITADTEEDAVLYAKQFVAANGYWPGENSLDKKMARLTATAVKIVSYSNENIEYDM